MFKKVVFTLCSLLFFSSCSNDATVLIFEKNLPKNKITCINLLVFPPDDNIQSTFEKLYDFDENCSIRVEVSTKSGISCNSNHNYQTKAVGSFPSSYLKIQMNNGSKIVYSYYVDLKNAVTPEDVKQAFFRMKDDLDLE